MIKLVDSKKENLLNALNYVMDNWERRKSREEIKKEAATLIGNSETTVKRHMTKYKVSWDASKLKYISKLDVNGNIQQASKSGA